MSKNLSYPLGILLTILIGTWFYFTCCSDCQMVQAAPNPEPENVVEATPNPTQMPFAISGEGININENDNFNFNLDGSTILEPLSDKLGSKVADLATYLNANPDKALNITGYYKSAETNTSAYPNLGLARANAVKNYLSKAGINTSQTNLFGVLKDDLIPDDEVLLGPVSYEMVGIEADHQKDDLKALYDEIVANPLTVYFETGSSNVSLTAAQREKMVKIVTYLDKVPTAKCNVVGHTDNTGSRVNNIKLAQDRAEIVKNFLIGQNLAADKIVTNSKGPDAPIADNATDEGRKLNRRTEITLLNN